MRMRKITDYRLSLLAAAGAAVMALAAPAMAQPGSVTLSGSVAPFDEGVQVLGAAPGQVMVRFDVNLKLRDYKGLAASNFAGKVMSPAQMERDHLPTKADYDRVLNWVSGTGLTVDKTSASRMSIQVSGTVAQVSHALGVHFSRIRSDGRDFVSADTAPAVPASVASAVHSVIGLQPELHAIKNSIIAPQGPHTDSATSPPFYPQAFISAYSATGLGLGGKGATTAIVIDTFPDQNDLKQYWKTTGTKQSIKNFTFIQVNEGDLPPLSGEESMDAQVSSSIAPKSKVRVYASQSLDFKALNRTFQRVIDDIDTGGVKITQVSVSLGACEKKLPAKLLTQNDNFFAVLSGLGASVFVSTGDHGSRECGKQSTSFYATSPNVTGAGGTHLGLNSNGTVANETGWNGSGGGISSFFATPSYQTDLGFAKRAIPDFSADADPNSGALVIVHGGTNQIGGTSLSAPILAGLTALANADRIKHRKAPLGLINSRIYSIPASNFRDITSGNNTDYTAGPGYDLVTGLGAPIMSELIPTLTGQE